MKKGLEMEAYQYLRDENQKICGLWLANPEDANGTFIAMLLLKVDAPEAVRDGYRIAPNTLDNKGGCFVLFGSTNAPGESVPKQKKWWHFWK